MFGLFGGGRFTPAPQVRGEDWEAPPFFREWNLGPLDAVALPANWIPCEPVVRDDGGDVGAVHFFESPDMGMFVALQAEVAPRAKGRDAIGTARRLCDHMAGLLAPRVVAVEPPVVEPRCPGQPAGGFVLRLVDDYVETERRDDVPMRLHRWYVSVPVAADRVAFVRIFLAVRRDLVGEERAAEEGGADTSGGYVGQMIRHFAGEARDARIVSAALGPWKADHGEAPSPDLPPDPPGLLLGPVELDGIGRVLYVGGSYAGRSGDSQWRLRTADDRYRLYYQCHTRPFADDDLQMIGVEAAHALAVVHGLLRPLRTPVERTMVVTPSGGMLLVSRASWNETLEEGDADEAGVGEDDLPGERPHLVHHWVAVGPAFAPDGTPLAAQFEIRLEIDAAAADTAATRALVAAIGGQVEVMRLAQGARGLVVDTVRDHGRRAEVPPPEWETMDPAGMDTAGMGEAAVEQVDLPGLGTLCLPCGWPREPHESGWRIAGPDGVGIRLALWGDRYPAGPLDETVEARVAALFRSMASQGPVVWIASDTPVLASMIDVLFSGVASAPVVAGRLTCRCEWLVFTSFDIDPGHRAAVTLRVRLDLPDGVIRHRAGSLAVATLGHQIGRLRFGFDDEGPRLTTAPLTTAPLTTR